jgi:hypothetical protein
MYTHQTLFGWYDQGVLTNLVSATDTFVATLDAINGAAGSIGGKTPADVPSLVAQAKSQKKTYVDALNLYTSQFGGEQSLGDGAPGTLRRPHQLANQQPHKPR